MKPLTRYLWLLLGIAMPVCAFAQEAKTGKTLPKSVFQIYLESTALDKVYLVAGTAFAYGIGYWVFTRLIPTKHFPSSAGRFGCFWFAATFLVLHFLIAIFFLHIHVAKWLLALLVIILAVWLVVVYKKKRVH